MGSAPAAAACNDYDIWIVAELRKARATWNVKYPGRYTLGYGPV